MNTLFLILGSYSEENQNDLQMQKVTWLQDLLPSQSYFVLRGSHNKTTNVIDDTIYLPVSERYENILEKTILGIEWALENLNFDVLIRTNVSTYFPPQLVENEIEKIDSSSKYFGGYLDKSKIASNETDSIASYVTGTALVMTKSTATALCRSDWDKMKTFPDDLAITILLKNQGIEPKKMKRNNLSQSHFFYPTFQIRLKTSSVSRLAAQRMKLIHGFFHPSNRMNQLFIFIKIIGLEVRYATMNQKEFSDFLIYMLVSIRNKLLRISSWVSIKWR
jgi:hypothetical protein